MAPHEADDRRGKNSVPTLYDWLGGMPALERLTTRFYDKVRLDDDLGPVFTHMDGDHPRFVAQFLAEVFGGPPMYSSSRGGHAHMVMRHMNKHLSQPQRRRWMELLLETADDVGFPDDPEFRSAFVAYIEWGSRLAVINSQGESEVPADSPMPRWGWGELGGPHQGPDS